MSESLSKSNSNPLVATYLQNFDSYPCALVYDFRLTQGGIADCLKFFMFLFEICRTRGIRLYYLQHEIPIEKYVFVKHAQMRIRHETLIQYSKDGSSIQMVQSIDELKELGHFTYHLIRPHILYNVFSFDQITVPFSSIFEISQDIIENVPRIFPELSTKSYISVHLRLGDRFMETDKEFVLCKTDTRKYDQQSMFSTIEQLLSDPNQVPSQVPHQVLFFCDNRKYKMAVQNKFPKLVISTAEIGHTSFLNTTNEQVLNTITEFYVLTQSEKIIAISYSGFPVAAAKYNNIPIELREPI